jgi:general secretion pathway protein J
MMPKLQRAQGFTLFELLIAIAILAIMTLMLSHILQNFLRAQTQQKQAAQELFAWQTAVNLLAMDSHNCVDRPIMQGSTRQAALILQEKPMLWSCTSSRLVDPKGAALSLFRVAYRCEQHQLIRNVWTELDHAQKNSGETQILLSKITDCQFSFLNNGSWIDAFDSDQNKIMPQAFKIKLCQGANCMERLWPLAIGVWYAPHTKD